MNYTAVAVGKHEMDMPLIDALSNYTLNNPLPRILAANLLDTQGHLFQGLVRPWEIGGQGSAPKVGVVGLVGLDVTTMVKDPSLKFAQDSSVLLTKALGELRIQKADLVVLLYQGSVKGAKACAVFCAQSQKTDPTLPQVHVIQCLSDDEEPPSVPERAGNSLIVTVGHKGRYVGVVGVFRTGKTDRPFDLRYQLVSIGPEYKTREGQEASNPIHSLMEEYTKELKDRDYLARFPRTPHAVQIQYPKARYVGSERCAECHEKADEIWSPSGHAKAYQALVDARRPSLRQFDGECAICHVVGFGHPSGYYDKDNSSKKNELLKNVGCESCHGPASVHVNNPTDATIYPFINPWKAKPGETEAASKARRLRIDLFCQKCHDVDNDVHWSFDKNWPRIIHNTPRKAAQAK
jgi:nitrate reductase cytochrome c-type subunit